ncbi:chromosome segregation protein [Microdochium nivale]|nr:chromosome segregation protein [Microdochium nivale]
MHGLSNSTAAWKTITFEHTFSSQTLGRRSFDRLGTDLDEDRKKNEELLCVIDNATNAYDTFNVINPNRDSLAAEYQAHLDEGGQPLHDVKKARIQTEPAVAPLTRQINACGKTRAVFFAVLRLLEMNKFVTDVTVAIAQAVTRKARPETAICLDHDQITRSRGMDNVVARVRSLRDEAITCLRSESDAEALAIILNVAFQRTIVAAETVDTGRLALEHDRLRLLLAEQAATAELGRKLRARDSTIDALQARIQGLERSAEDAAATEERLTNEARERSRDSELDRQTRKNDELVAEIRNVDALARQRGQALEAEKHNAASTKSRLECEPRQATGGAARDKAEANRVVEKLTKARAKLEEAAGRNSKLHGECDILSRDKSTLHGQLADAREQAGKQRSFRDSNIESPQKQTTELEAASSVARAEIDRLRREIGKGIK